MSIFKFFIPPKEIDFLENRFKLMRESSPLFRELLIEATIEKIKICSVKYFNKSVLGTIHLDLSNPITSDQCVLLSHELSHALHYTDSDIDGEIKAFETQSKVRKELESAGFEVNVKELSIKEIKEVYGEYYGH